MDEREVTLEEMIALRESQAYAQRTVLERYNTPACFLHYEHTGACEDR